MKEERTDRLADAIGYANDEFIKDAHAKKNRKKQFAKSLGAVAACLAVVLCAGYAVKHLKKAPDIKIGGDILSRDRVPYTTDDRIILWAESDGGSGDPQFIDTEAFIELGENVKASYSFMSFLDSADDDDLVGFAVSVTDLPEQSDGTRSALRIEALREAYVKADEELSETALRCENELMEGGISRTEAQARKFSSEEFIIARENAAKARKEYENARMANLYGRSSDAIKHLVDLGFTPFCTAENEDCLVFFSARNAVCLMATSKANLVKIASEEKEFSYYLTPAPDPAEIVKYTFSDFYSDFEIHLSDGEKMTDELISAYEEAGSTPLDVIVCIAYEEEELDRGDIDARALAVLGITEKELDNATSETIDRFIEERNRIIYHKDENKEIAETLFAPGEVVEIMNWMGSIKASLTHERARELSESKRIAYIRLAGEGSGTSNIYMSDDVECE